MALEFCQVALSERGQLSPALGILIADFLDAGKKRRDPSLSQHIAEIAEHAGSTQKCPLTLKHLIPGKEMLYGVAWGFLKNKTPRSLAVRATRKGNSRWQQSLHRRRELRREHTASPCLGNLCKRVPYPAGGSRGRDPDLRLGEIERSRRNAFQQSLRHLVRKRLRTF